MFLGSAIDFLAPNYIGKLINKFKEDDFTAVRNVVIEWVAVVVFSALCSALREGIFGIASQRLGKNMRQMFFESLINKDVNFYDNFRTGDMLSRLGSDTQVVQDGLTTNVAMFIKAICICLGCIVIVATYNGWLCLIVIGAVLPQILVTRWSAHYLNIFYARYQKEKGEMSHIGKESISDIRTVKAFANEEMTCLRFATKN